MGCAPPRDLWLKRPVPNRDARVRLFCFAYAGGAASIFHRWPQGLQRAIELVAIQPPGREERLGSPALTCFSEMVAAVTQAILPLLDRPYGFFGHSLGGLLAFEVARELRMLDCLGPTHLFVSGCESPDVANRAAPTHGLPDEEFLSVLRQLGGTPDSVLQHHDLMGVLLPMLRADFSVYESYRYDEQPPLDCSITTFGGAEDPHVSDAALNGWQQHTTGDWSKCVFPGGHFFLNELWRTLTQVVGAALLFATDSRSTNAGVSGDDVNTSRS